MKPRHALLAVLLAASQAHAQPAPRPARGFVEGGVAYGWGLSTSPFVEVDRGTRLDGPGASGPAIDLVAGYAPVPGLFVIGDLQWAHTSTIVGQNQDGDTDQSKVSHLSFAIGARLTRPLGRGELYGQLSLGMVTPFETERDQQNADGTSRTTTVGYNAGFGGRGEMGYHYDVSDRLFVAGGIRIQTFATDNVGRERVRVDQPGGQVERETYSTDPNANNTRRAEALSLQELRFRLGIGYRF